MGVIVVVWIGPGVLQEGRVILAHPGERVRLDSLSAEKWVRAGKARYPRN